MKAGGQGRQGGILARLLGALRLMGRLIPSWALRPSLAHPTCFPRHGGREPPLAVDTPSGSDTNPAWDTRVSWLLAGLGARGAGRALRMVPGPDESCRKPPPPWSLPSLRASWHGVGHPAGPRWPVVLWSNSHCLSLHTVPPAGPLLPLTARLLHSFGTSRKPSLVSPRPHTQLCLVTRCIRWPSVPLSATGSGPSGQGPQLVGSAPACCGVP